MPIDDRTSSRNYQKPAAANLLSEDVVRLRAALDAIDVDVAGLLTALPGLATLLNPGFSGMPTVPTPDLDSNTQQIINAAYLLGMLSSANPVMDGTAAAGTSTRLARADHRHPVDSSRAPLASPAFTGTPTAPTPLVADDSTRLATTAWVLLQAFVRGNRTVFAGAGLTGGGDLSANRTIAADFASQAEAEVGTSSTKLMTPQRTNQAIAVAVPPLVSAQVQTAATGVAVAFSIVFG